MRITSGSTFLKFHVKGYELRHHINDILFFDVLYKKQPRMPY